MVFFRAAQRFLAAPLAVVFLFASVAGGSASAGLVGTEEVVASETSALERQRLTTFLQRQDVRDQFVALGVDPREAETRVASLTDAEVREMNGHLDRLPAGQGAVGVVVGAIVLIFLVLLITDLLGLTDVFPFVKSQARSSPPPRRASR